MKKLMLFALLLVGQAAVAQKNLEGRYLIEAGRRHNAGIAFMIGGAVVPLLIASNDRTGNNDQSYKADNTPYYVVGGVLELLGLGFHIAGNNSLIKAGREANKKTTASLLIAPTGAQLRVNF